MGLILRAIPLERVVAILQKKGYGVAQMRRYALALNKGTGERYESGSEKRSLIGGISSDVLNEILLRSENEQEAAQRIEDAILGKEMLPIEDARAATRGGDGLDLVTVERLVGNRVVAEVNRVLKPNLDQIPQMVADAVKPYIDQMLGVINTVKELVKSRGEVPSLTNASPEVDNPEQAGKKRKGKKGGVKYERTEKQKAHAEKMRQYWTNRHAERKAAEAPPSQ